MYGDESKIPNNSLAGCLLENLPFYVVDISAYTRSKQVIN